MFPDRFHKIHLLALAEGLVEPPNFVKRHARIHKDAIARLFDQPVRPGIRQTHHRRMRQAGEHIIRHVLLGIAPAPGTHSPDRNRDLDAGFQRRVPQRHRATPRISGDPEPFCIDFGTAFQIIKHPDRIPDTDSHQMESGQKTDIAAFHMFGCGSQRKGFPGFGIFEILKTLALPDRVKTQSHIAPQCQKLRGTLVSLHSLAIGRMAAGNQHAGHWRRAILGHKQIRSHIKIGTALTDDFLNPELLAFDCAGNLRIQWRFLFGHRPQRLAISFEQTSAENFKILHSLDPGQIYIVLPTVFALNAIQILIDHNAGIAVFRHAAQDTGGEMVQRRFL